MRHIPLTICTCLLVAPVTYAESPQVCSTAIRTDLDAEAAETLDESTVELTAGEFEAGLGENASASMSGGVTVRRGNKLAGADSATFDPESRTLSLDGDVRYEDPGTRVLSDSAEFSYESGRIEFAGAEFSVGSNNARGAADNILINQEGELQLDDVSYTTCPPGSNDWELEAADIDLDTRNGVGTARNIRLRFQGLPILYAPYISFPVGDARKSGILAPEVGSSGRSGREIRVPYYWNIAPNYDATITPRVLTDRGLQLQTEFRYLTERDNGTIVAQYLPDDNLIDKARHLISVKHRSVFDNGWRARIDLRDVSDGQYFEDLGGSLSASSTTHLNRSLSFDLHTDTMSLFGQLQHYQTLDSAIMADERPYRRLPQLTFRGSWPQRWFDLSVDSEIANFDRDTGVTGWRANAETRVDLPIQGHGWFVKPGVAWDITHYQLDGTANGVDDNPTRSLPITTFDTGMLLQRTLGNSQRVQTLEPRLLYVHVPFRDQSDLPVFDTITPDLNLVQLFRPNRFLGGDRIGDTDQVSIGITSRIRDVSSGEELMSATIGQTRYLSDRQVTLPGALPTDFESSDYIAELSFLLYENLNFDIGHQWGTGDAGTTQSEARLQYRPAVNKILNLAYRFRRDSLEQGDLSWSWPLTSKWNFVGRYNYSFRDEEALEQFFGLEYESCCWGLRLVSRRHISTRDGTRDSSFGLQLVLKGMTSVGTAADKLLERGILGYSASLR